VRTAVNSVFETQKYALSLSNYVGNAPTGRYSPFESLLRLFFGGLVAVVALHGFMGFFAFYMALA